jgi:hypothetical protein
MNRPNGVIRINNQLFVSDTGMFIGNGKIDPSLPHTLYKVTNGSINEFSTAKVGAPDGLVEFKDTLCAGEGDGVTCYSVNDGSIIHKLVLKEVVANLVIHGTSLLVLNEFQIWEIPLPTV